MELLFLFSLLPLVFGALAPCYPAKIDDSLRATPGEACCQLNALKKICAHPNGDRAATVEYDFGSDSVLSPSLAGSDPLAGSTNVDSASFGKAVVVPLAPAVSVSMYFRLRSFPDGLSVVDMIYSTASGNSTSDAAHDHDLLDRELEDAKVPLLLRDEAEPKGWAYAVRPQSGQRVSPLVPARLGRIVRAQGSEVSRCSSLQVMGSVGNATAKFDPESQCIQLQHTLGSGRIKYAIVLLCAERLGKSKFHFGISSLDGSRLVDLSTLDGSDPAYISYDFSVNGGRGKNCNDTIGIDWIMRGQVYVFADPQTATYQAAVKDVIYSDQGLGVLIQAPVVIPG